MNKTKKFFERKNLKKISTLFFIFTLVALNFLTLPNFAKADYGCYGQQVGTLVETGNNTKIFTGVVKWTANYTGGATTPKKYIFGSSETGATVTAGGPLNSKTTNNTVTIKYSNAVGRNVGMQVDFYGANGLIIPGSTNNCTFAFPESILGGNTGSIYSCSGSVNPSDNSIDWTFGDTVSSVKSYKFTAGEGGSANSNSKTLKFFYDANKLVGNHKMTITLFNSAGLSMYGSAVCDLTVTSDMLVTTSPDVTKCDADTNCNSYCRPAGDTVSDAAYATCATKFYADLAAAGGGNTINDSCASESDPNSKSQCYSNLCSADSKCTCSLPNDQCVINFIKSTSVAAGGGTVVNGGASEVNFQLPNPLKAKSLTCLVYDVVNGTISVLSIVAGLFIIYSGFLFIKAQGNEQELKKARHTFMNVIIGTAILLGAWAIVSFVINTIQGVTSQPLPNVPTSGYCS